MNGISRLTQVFDRQSSDIRIYCDEDSKWESRSDHPKETVKNSNKPAEDQFWVDEVNKMMYRGPPGCKDPSTFAETFVQRMPKSGSEKPYRATMTICKEFAVARFTTLDEQDNKDFSRVPLTAEDSENGVLMTLLSVTLLHEANPCANKEQAFTMLINPSLPMSPGMAVSLTHLNILRRNFNLT